jgi:cation diffusion facilitator family transporter
MDRVEQDKLRAASLSLATNAILTILKLGAATLTGSISLLTEGFHSATDVLSSILALVSVRVAAAPPDEEHPYGHAKVESVTGFAEASMLGMLSLLAIYQGVIHLSTRAVVGRVEVGIGTGALCALFSLAAAWHVLRVGRSSKSPVLATNGFHLLFDSITTAGVVAGLILVRVTGIHAIDSYLGICLGVWLLVSSYRLGMTNFQELIDRRLPDDEFARVKSLISSEPGVISFHRLRTRLSGRVRYLDFHVVVPNDWSVVQAHEVADRLEHRLAAEFDPAAVVVHVDPYDEVKAARGKEERTLDG